MVVRQRLLQWKEHFMANGRHIVAEEHQYCHISKRDRTLFGSIMQPGRLLNRSIYNERAPENDC